MAKGVIARLRIGRAAGVGVRLFVAIVLAQAPDGGLPRALGVALVLRAARHESGLGELLTSDL